MATRALVMCARVDNPEDDVLLKPGAEQRACTGCGTAIWVSPSSANVPGATFTCNPCGRAMVLAQQVVNPVEIEMLIAPGALADDTPEDRRRRKELEARGWHDASPETIAELHRETKRPPRRVGYTHDWVDQAIQYTSRTDIDKRLGIVHWTVPRNLTPVPIECLLYWANGKDGRLVLAGIFNYFPEGSPYGEQPHDTVTLVNPQWRRQGIGKALLTEGLRRWPQIDLLKQSYTDEGWALATSVLEGR